MSFHPPDAGLVKGRPTNGPAVAPAEVTLLLTPISAGWATERAWVTRLLSAPMLPSPTVPADHPNKWTDTRPPLPVQEAYDYVDGGPVTAAHPHPVYARVAAAGYRIEYRVETEAGPHRLLVRATTGGTGVASALFSDLDGDGSLHRIAVEVHPDHRRRGLATAMHLFAEAVSGKSLVGFWGDDHLNPPPQWHATIVIAVAPRA